ncbi:YhgE/Pip domain-containing protein [Streptomyces hiroshimensis]|uniref:Membrane protein n=1 Tax=Streptomyces hiroshimensis TaxID=66424 RepID=A0ABQ2YZI4_9ACTN|nr:DUF3533 domain-containing protein [Streptomyces hiroshimensis]GGY00479.1 membrane protein [Streptomyces hiroshimensis]
MPSFVQELRSAVTGRAAVLVIGALVLQLAFIASYVGAFHSPRPKDVALGVVAPQQITGQLVQRLGGLPGGPLDPRAVDGGEAAAVAKIRERDLDAALVVDPRGTTDTLLVAGGAGASLAQATEAVLTRAEAVEGRKVRTKDVAPSAAGDARGLTSFYLVVGWCVGGYLCAAILAISAGARPANPHRAVIRLGALALYAAAAGLFGAVIAGPVLDALPGGILGLWGLGALVVFAVGATTLALQGLAGIVGIGLAIAIVVVLGNPSAGGAYPYPLLPPFWNAIGPALPPGAGTWSARSLAYFHGNGLTGPLLVLSAWAVAGTVVTMVCAGMRRRGREGDA